MIENPFVLVSPRETGAFSGDRPVRRTVGLMVEGRAGLLAGMYSPFCYGTGLAHHSASFDQGDGGASGLA
jgi:hypothetical protein